MSLALILWTLFLSWRYTFPISGSYSLSASMAFSAFRSWSVEEGGKCYKQKKDERDVWYGVTLLYKVN